MPIVFKNGYYYFSNKKTNETTEEVYDRLYFTISQFKNTPDVKYIEKYYNIWKNKKKYECEYNEDLMKQVDILENNVYSVSATFIHN